MTLFEDADDYAAFERVLAEAVQRTGMRLFMHNKNRVSLSRGTAEFVVPKNAIGFTVALPDRTTIVDLGTAFRVAVDESGAAQIRVIEGLVAWTTPGELGESVLIAAGDSAQRFDGKTQTSEPAQAGHPALTKVLLEDAEDLTRRFSGKLVVARNFGVTDDYAVGDIVFRGQDQEAVGDVAAPGSNYARSNNRMIDFAGDDADDRALESVLMSRRWGRDVQSVLIAGLSSEARYRLYLLTGESVGHDPPVNRRVLTSLKVEGNELLSRNFAIVDFQADGLEDGLGSLPNTRKTAVLLDITGLTAADGTLDVELRTDGPEGANHPTLHGFALVEVGPAAPEHENTAPTDIAEVESPFVEPAP